MLLNRFLDRLLLHLICCIVSLICCQGCLNERSLLVGHSTPYAVLSKGLLNYHVQLCQPLFVLLFLGCPDQNAWLVVQALLFFLVTFDGERTRNSCCLPAASLVCQVSMGVVYCFGTADCGNCTGNRLCGIFLVGVGEQWAIFL